MLEYFRKARAHCWKIYDKYYRDGEYQHHNARYRETIMKHLTRDTCLLDAGCGSEMGFTREFSSQVRMAIGVDIEEITLTTPDAHGIQGNLNFLPFKDSSFDIIISMSVLEHLADPEKVFHEFSRILKPNGIVLLQTPNKYDYVAIIAKITPFWFHRWILSRLLDRKEADTFPTFYYANTRKQILSLLKRSNFYPLTVILFNQYPAYLMFSPFLFRLGIFYEKLTSRYNIFEQLRGWVLAVAQKKE